ncbi:putative LRR receptor-like serine/threonine-protein kinase [Prunus yedoensis var. nudiflora]|uniref:non-specific serine/threonine protein kinase n=1 Tax=Prunus yedoensis var. nudiflora TaxID=2094558 RepID=A0A314Y7V8_PRUYE|nr:putative LRR receptor-like serine/threonine-protein kinase [Prunus yedoensis var. nudiflora]
MYQSRVWTYAAVFATCLCWFSLRALAQNLDITHPAEVTALQAIKGSLVDPNKNLSNWNRGDPCTANWTGVLCYNTSLSDGYLHVKELQLLNMNLSGSLSPELGRFSFMKILDFMWNKITGSIPKEIGNITSLELLLLNGNQLSGPLPDELGYLPNLDRIQIDQNYISGSLPKSFAYLNKTKHFHMNNNSISGQIPHELSRLPSLVHFLLDNNNLSGYLPPQFSELPNLLILQLDNNNFDGTTIPDSYSKMSKLLKLSLRNCSLQGPIPDLSGIPNLGYIDLSSNQLNGSLPSGKLSDEITTINLSNNNLTGTIPANFSGLPHLQKLSIANNSLDGSVPASLWQNRTLNATGGLILELQNNNLTTISGTGSTEVPLNVTVWLRGNPVCSSANLNKFCGSESDDKNSSQGSTNSTASYFRPYKSTFEEYLTTGLNLSLDQLDITSFDWEKGPRLRMYLKLFPVHVKDNSSHTFNESEVQRIMGMFTSWNIPDSTVFGPYELINFILLDPYKNVVATSTKSGLGKGALAGIILGTIAGAVTLSAIVSLLILRKHLRTTTQFQEDVIHPRAP